jgi:hypothetical protein
MPAPAVADALAAWQAIFAGVAAAGTVGAAGVAGWALIYFKRQASATEATLEELRKEALAEHQRWQDERLRESRRDHAAVRPTVGVAFGGGSLGPDAAGMTVTFQGGRAIRDISASVVLDDRDVRAECVPNEWVETNRHDPAQIVFDIRASGVQTGDKALLTLVYHDALGSAVTILQPLVADTMAGMLRLNRDGPPTEHDDLELAPVVGAS